MARVVLAMSGGVDSSVAAHFLRQQGHEVVGVFMRHGERSPAAGGTDAGGVPSGVRDPLLDAACTSAVPIGTGGLAILGERPDHKQGCCSASDAEDARRVADRLDIPFYALDMQQEFGRIIDYFVDDYLRGRTPNPCVMCNNWLKFGRLFDYADDIQAEFVATGHYAQLVPHNDGCVQLHRGVDAGKDQSYVLFGIRRDRLRRMMLPVGGFDKPQIREIATQLGLRVAGKRDSQEICFVTSGDHAQFIRQRRCSDDDRSGTIVTTDGRVVGQHQGIEAFTIGQRKGLGVALGEPYFVVRIEPDSRRVVIGRRHELDRTELTATDTNWLVSPPAGSFRCQAQIRYQHQAQAATARVEHDGRLRVVFDQPCFGIAPGQAVVCYRDTQVLGGGWIE
ncbi:MAG: tRNA 2-thiouridine(34) synthase MnmA [Planctomycetaceae bacterium]|nr:MAG: tRNA 2-thiouridine(34) synthase MnmA [Planctomycetaceae bacterium]